MAPFFKWLHKKTFNSRFFGLFFFGARKCVDYTNSSGSISFVKHFLVCYFIQEKKVCAYNDTKKNFKNVLDWRHQTSIYALFMYVFSSVHLFISSCFFFFLFLNFCFVINIFFSHFVPFIMPETFFFLKKILRSSLTV